MGSLSCISTITTFVFFSLFPGIYCEDGITPDYTVSYLKFIEDHGAFLYSQNKTFKAAIHNPGHQQENFYLCVIHVVSNTITWVANRDASVSNSGNMRLSSDGMTISDEDGSQKWSTPQLNSPVSTMVLNETGNLVLLDENNVSLWNSFDYPSDTLVIGQHVEVGTLLRSALSDTELSRGNYSLSVTSSDMMLHWDGLTYWKLSMDLHAHRNSNYVVDYLVMDEKGLYLFGHNGSVVVLEANLPPSEFRIAKLNTDGQFIISSYSDAGWKQDFLGPGSSCGIPNICGRIGLCTPGGSSTTNPACSCPSGFRADPQQTKGCIPSDSSFSLPLACNSSKKQSSNSQNISYLGLGAGESSFAETFLDPDTYGITLSACQDLCSANCSCLAIFYKNSSGSCFLIRDQLGSLLSNAAGGTDRLGYIKTHVALSQSDDKTSSNGRRHVSVVALVVSLVVGLFVAAAVGIIWWIKWKKSKVGLEKTSNPESTSSGEIETFYIPGLPVRYDFEDLKVATDNFRNQIGSGGFGVVYRGVLLDGTAVAVKKLTNLGTQGKKDFCTEIAVIGNIHHVNLVKLKGFCAQGSQRLLVYEYMNHGSLDRTLFGCGPVLEWQERFDIALGAARALAYLHSGCEHKIIHCDVKPENILLHDHFQPKISDFGLSKLLNPEQSSHFTTMRGTRGYLAPEWLTSSAISEKTDVYSYGMVLLELVSGRKNCSWKQQSHSLDDKSSGGTGNHSSGSSSSGLIYFPMFALEMHEQGKYSELADPRLEGRVTSEEVEKLVRIALCCVHEEPALRPTMVTIVAMLEERIQSGCPRLESLNFLRFYGRRFSEPSVIESSDQQSDILNHHQPSDALLSEPHQVNSSLSDVSSQEISGPR